MLQMQCAGYLGNRVQSSFVVQYAGCHFAGTENRKPLSYAYVAITLDNSDHKLQVDYEEVTIARRVYRSGESEYLMNGSPCRLKDVNELFYDTGNRKRGLFHYRSGTD